MFSNRNTPTLFRRQIDEPAFIHRLDSLAPSDLAEMVRGFIADADQDRDAAERLSIYRTWKSRRQWDADQAAKASALGLDQEPTPASPPAAPMSAAEANEIRREIEALSLRAELSSLQADQVRRDAEEARFQARAAFAERATQATSTTTTQPARSSDVSTANEIAELDAIDQSAREWAKQRQAGSSKGGAEPQQNESELERSSREWLQRALRPPGDAGPAPEPIVPVTDAAVERAMSLMGGELAALAETQVDPARFGRSSVSNWDHPRLVRDLEREARDMAVAQMLGAGLSLEDGEIRRLAGEWMLRSWIGRDDIAVGPMGNALARAAHGAREHLQEIERIDSELARLDAGLKSREIRLAAYLKETGSLIPRRDGHLAGLAARRSSLEKLPAALAGRVVGAVELAGGIEKVVAAIRESKVIDGTFPGKDRRLDDLRTELDEADSRMKALLPPSGEEPGELYRVALERRDELAEAIQARRAVALQEASGKIRVVVEAAIGGDAGAFDKVLERVRKTPEAFPEEFRQVLERAPLEAISEAGAVGFFWLTV